MKKIFNTIQFIVALLVCMGSVLRAQTGYEPVRNQLNSIFSPLNKTQITTGILHEYGYQLINNHEVDATDTLDYGAWNGIYYSLFSGRISGTQTLQPLENINTHIWRKH